MRIEDATEELREKLRKATQLRMLRSDVPVGSYLSGGLDSSVIARMGREAKEGEFRTFSIRFEDDEFDETSFQRKMASTLDSQHAEYVVTKKEIAEVFPDVVYHAERPILRTAPAPLFMLSKLVRESGYKVVITGEGADEMLAGYDLFREAKIREFMARNPDSVMRQKLFERLYPYLARSPQQAKGMSIEFWKRGLDRAGKPGFSHAPRWTTTASLKRFFNASLQEELTTSPGHDVLEEIPENFSTWDTLGQAQFLEVTTLLSSYLISSQGDRMLMAHSVEGRFPFLDVEVMEFCNALPAQYKLIGLNEKNILKRLAKGKIPQEIIDRKKQPYRAPDAICFAVKDAPAYVAEMFSENALSRAGIFDVRSAIGLYEKCRARAAGGASDGTFSNTDNMGFIGILSLQLLADQFVRQGIAYAGDDIQFTTFVDRVTVLSH
jgi:asparagine synthase (glutamine-hydrolysing)